MYVVTDLEVVYYNCAGEQEPEFQLISNLEGSLEIAICGLWAG